MATAWDPLFRMAAKTRKLDFVVLQTMEPTFKLIVMPKCMSGIASRSSSRKEEHDYMNTQAYPLPSLCPPPKLEVACLHAYLLLHLFVAQVKDRVLSMASS